MIDTSAVLAIYLNEPERHVFREKINHDKMRLLSAVSFVESSVVVSRRHGATGSEKLDALLSAFGIEVVAVDFEQALVARRAYTRFGKGNHAARLNLGDCFAYALSVTSGEPLLFKGDDFSLTDVQPA